MDKRSALRALFDAAVAAALPERMAGFLPEPPKGRTVVIGAGKGAGSMAAALEKVWPHPLEGVVVTRYGHAVPTQRIRVLEARHPVPDAAGEAASRALLAAVEGLTADDLVIALISGGGSALLALPAPGLSLADLQAVNAALLASGAEIGAMNAVRKHVSAINGGRLALACAPARLVTLAISDVPGDDPAVIASGPTVPDPSTRAEALDIVRRHAMALPQAVMDWLGDPACESPKADHPAFARSAYHLIARPIDSLHAAAAKAAELGLPPVLVLGDTIEGEAKEVARVHLALARSVLEHGLPQKGPLVILSGGETTVTLPPNPKGRGGRNAEFALALLDAMAGLPPALQGRICALAADTDGIDGVEDNAGALVSGDSLARAAALGLKPRAFLDAHDAYGFFAAMDDLLVTGPTHTNVNDFRAIWVG